MNVRRKALINCKLQYQIYKDNFYLHAGREMMTTNIQIKIYHCGRIVYKKRKKGGERRNGETFGSKLDCFIGIWYLKEYSFF
jgi:hypothetical protein